MSLRKEDAFKAPNNWQQHSSMKGLLTEKHGELFHIKVEMPVFLTDRDAY